MKARKDLKSGSNTKVFESEDLKRGRKLKPEKKEKNQKRSIFSEIEDLDDPELLYSKEEEDFLDDDIIDEDDSFEGEDEDLDDED
jgi:hypothetical protein